MDLIALKNPNTVGNSAGRARPRPPSTPPPWPPRDNTRERISSESRTSSGEVGSSQHKRSNSSRELSSPPKPKWAEKLTERTTETKVLEDDSTACNDLTMCCELMAEEHGKPSESHAKAYHQYGNALSAWSRMEGKIFEHAMSGFDLNESEEPKVEVEDTENRAHEERYGIEDGISDL